MSQYWECLQVSYGMVSLGPEAFQTMPHGIEQLYPKWRKKLAALRGSQQKASLKLKTIDDAFDDAYFKSVTPLEEEEKFRPVIDVYLKFEYPNESPGVASRRVHALLHSIYLWDALCLARETAGKEPPDFRVYAFAVGDFVNYSLSQITDYFKKKVS